MGRVWYSCDHSHYRIVLPHDAITFNNALLSLNRRNFIG